MEVGNKKQYYLPTFATIYETQAPAALVAVLAQKRWTGGAQAGRKPVLSVEGRRVGGGRVKREDEMRALQGSVVGAFWSISNYNYLFVGPNIVGYAK